MISRPKRGPWLQGQQWIFLGQASYFWRVWSYMETFITLFVLRETLVLPIRPAAASHVEAYVVWFVFQAMWWSVGQLSCGGKPQGTQICLCLEMTPFFEKCQLLSKTVTICKHVMSTHTYYIEILFKGTTRI